MAGWVVKPFLTEDHVKILQRENMMPDLAMCSKAIIIDNIIEYVNGDGDEEVKAILMKNYKDKIDLVEAQSSDLVINNVDEVYGFTFSSVHAGLNLKELESMKETILSVYNEEYNVPYENVIPGDIIAGIINNLLAIYRVNNNMEYKKLAYLLTKNKELFKDKPNASAKGTIFKAINRRSDDLNIILRGIEFLIDQKTKGNLTESWRVY